MSDLDDWFSKCDGILADWTGSGDAMRSEPSKGHVELRAGESYYAQREYATPGGLIVERMIAVTVLAVMVPPLVLAGLVVGTVRAMRGRRA